MEPRAFLATVAAFDPALTHGAVRKCRESLGAALRARFGGPAGQVRPPRRRVLRIGYVSSFFDCDNWMKPVWALLDHHDRRKVQVHLFSDSDRVEIVRRRARVARARVHDISRLDNAAAARRIARQRLDVLVDLNGFSRVSRLPVSLAKPAAVLVAWFNIFGTTGSDSFDALVGDEWLLRGGEDRWYVERLIRLPLSSLTFEVTYPVPRVQPPPCLRNGFVTFGSLAPLYKLNSRVIGAWAEILRRCPDSRLILASAALDDAGTRTHTLGRFARFGVSGGRLTLLGGAAHFQFLKRYHEIDIALDPFPYNGGTTTTEAIWQGVPVLAFAGDRWISRTSASILCNAGLQEFVRKDRADYIETAVRWGRSAKTPAKLRALRADMRSRLKRSPVCDAARLARCMEGVYRRLTDEKAGEAGA